MWCIPKLTEEYIERMEDLLDLYHKPYDATEPVVCFDEKSTQLLADTRPPQPTTTTRARKRDYEYKRNGTRNIFVAVEPKGGKRRTKVTKRRTKKDFADAIRQLIVNQYPRARTIHLVMDNLNTHYKKSLIETFGEAAADRLWSRLTVHYTPKHASWLNMAEIEIGILSRQALKKRLEDERRLKQETAAWERHRNRAGAIIAWTFTKKDARAVFKYGRHN
jgi:transposase